MPPSSGLLLALSHALSGAAGTAISTTATYPLDLVNTRLQAQRQLLAEGSLAAGDTYAGAGDAFRTIWNGGRQDGSGLAAFYAGVRQAVGKGVADSFLFFLFYNWFRARRLHGRGGRGGGRHLPVLEELAVGAAAGACARLFTTPIGNVVTRMQTASLVNGTGDGERSGGEAPSVRDIVAGIRREKGLLGLWAGYSASLVLTLNPSLTFFLNQVLEKAVMSSRGGLEGAWDDGASDAPGVGAMATFLLAAVSKTVATAVTYPFQTAKARVQVSSGPSVLEEARAAPEEENLIDMEEKKPPQVEEGTATATSEHSQPAIRAVTNGVRNLAQDTIFATVVRIARTEGIRALYDGIGGELLKAFFNHGTTMLSKDIVHRLLVRLYFVAIAALRRYPEARSRIVRTSHNVTEHFLRVPMGVKADNLRRRGTRYARHTYGAGERVIANVLEGSHRPVRRNR